MLLGVGKKQPLPHYYFCTIDTNIIPYFQKTDKKGRAFLFLFLSPPSS
jgi:hypothetical protein